MKAMTIRFSDEQDRWLRAAAFVLGVTITEILRRGVEEFEFSLPPDAAVRIKRAVDVAAEAQE